MNAKRETCLHFFGVLLFSIVCIACDGQDNPEATSDGGTVEPDPPSEKAVLDDGTEVAFLFISRPRAALSSWAQQT